MFSSREASLAPTHVPVGRSRGEILTESPSQETPGVGGSSRRLRRFRGFGQRLKSVKEVVQATGTPGPEYGYKPARISSTLTMWGVPEGLGGTPSPLGLSSQRNSQEPLRRGLKGMPASGKKRIKEMLCVLEEFRPRLAFWHVTLPDEDYFDLRDLGTWSVFQRRLYDRLVQYLVAHDDPALVAGVCEVGEVRLERTSRPMPHLHIVTSGYGSRIARKAYLLSPAVMDEFVQKAAEDAGLPPRDRQASSRLEPIRTSVSGYVDKYVTKGSGLPGKSLSDGWDALIPHQWWNRSDALHRMLSGLIFHLPPAFVAFVLQQRQRLESLKVGFGRVVQVGSRKTLCGEVPIEVDSFRFWTPEHLLMAWELFHWWLQDPKAWDEGGGACLHLDELASQNGETALPVIPLVIS
jgi:hypothetical protein